MEIFVSQSLPKHSEVFPKYWEFASKRQDLFFNKIRTIAPPWTNDRILSKYKFTNAYRASDRVSQYLIKNVIYNDKHTAEELYFRIILFKLFNKIETWEALLDEFGDVRYSDYQFEAYDKLLSDRMVNKKSIYSGAYIMSSGRSAFGHPKKHRNHLKLIEMMMKDGVPERITELPSMEALYHLLLSYPSIGEFLAYQFTIDINYSELTDFSENDFVVPGPGAKDGIRKCFSDYGDFSEVDIIDMMVKLQGEEFYRLGLEFQSLWGRDLQLIDCQNLFCEVSKYSRVSHPHVIGVSDRKRIKQKYSPTGGQIEYFYPPKWNLKEKIAGHAVNR